MKKVIVFSEGEDKRIIEAASQLNKSGYYQCILFVKDNFVANNLDLKIIKCDSLQTDDNINQLVKIRKNKISKSQAKELLANPLFAAPFYCTNHHVDAYIGGASVATGIFLKPVLQLIRLNNTCSSLFVMKNPKSKKTFIFSDCGLNISPDEKMLTQIAIQATDFAKKINIKPHVAFLSFSTLGSSSDPLALKIKNACCQFKKIYSDIPCIGEIQFDAAISSVVGKTKKIPQEHLGKANVFIFPDLNSGNIGYKIMQYFGGFEALGPIVVPTKTICSDLSRGCTSQDVINLAKLLAK